MKKIIKILSRLLVIVSVFLLLGNCRSFKETSHTSSSISSEVKEDSLETTYNRSDTKSKQKVVEVYDTIGRVVRKEIEVIEKEGLTNILNRQITLEGTHTVDTVTRIEYRDTRGFTIDYSKLNLPLFLIFLIIVALIVYKLLKK